MRVAELIETIETYADPAWQAEWDQSGIQVASEREDIKRLGVFLDPKPVQIERALQNGCDFLLSHHPLTLRPKLPAKLDSWYFALRLLLRSNVCLYAAHTSLDVNMAGPAGWLGRELGLLEMQPLEPIGASAILGYGQIGILPEPLPLGKLVNKTLKLLALECANLCGPESLKECERAAICGGSGASLVPLATQKDANLYVTGDIKYHEALDSEIAILDVGHHSIEEEMMRKFALLLAEELPGLEVEFYPSRPPFRRACQ